MSLKIMIVDDEPEIVSVIEDYLNKEGYETISSEEDGVGEP